MKIKYRKWDYCKKIKFAIILFFLTKYAKNSENMLFSTKYYSEYGIIIIENIDK